MPDIAAVDRTTVILGVADIQDVVFTNTGKSTVTVACPEGLVGFTVNGATATLGTAEERLAFAGLVGEVSVGRGGKGASKTTRVSLAAGRAGAIVHVSMD